MFPSSRFHKVIWSLNLLLLLGTLLSYLAPYVSPASFWPIAFAGLAYPFLAIGNLLFVLYWILFRKRFFWASLIALLIGIPYHADFFRIEFSSGPLEEGGESFQVMSFNVRLFGLYEWGSNKKKRDRIFRFLRTEEPDLLCFQEFFYSSEEGYFDTREPLSEMLPTKEYHDAYAHNAGNKHYFGIATFAKGPFIDKGRVPFPGEHQNICIYSDVRLGGDTVRVYNAHLSSIRTRGDKLNSWNGWSSILGKLKRAFIERAEQVDIIVEHMKASPHPVILCGDLNDTPISYAYHRFDAFLKDSFKESGNGLGRTYRGEMPSFRIDYIFHSPDIHSFDHEVIPEALSDHWPLQCRIQFRPDKE